MKNQAKWALSFCNRLVLQRRLSELTVGEGSTVYLWRVSGGRGSRIVVGNGSRVETRLTLERAGATLAVGDRSFVGEGQISCANRVEIGNDVMVAWGTSIFDHASHSLSFSERANDVGNWIRGVKDWDNVNTQAVRIANKAWIGFGCIVLPGVSIGEGAIIGAGAVVTRDVPSWTVSAGNPARVIRELAPDER